MSLKAFHVFFITVSIVLAVGFGAWAWRAYSVEGGGVNLVWMALAFVGAIGLAVYEVQVLKKFKKAGI